MVLFGSVMSPAKGLLTGVLRHATVRAWHGLAASGSPIGRLSTQGPKKFRSTELLNGRWVPFLPIYSALIRIRLGSSRSIPKLQLCSEGVRFAPGVGSGPVA